MHNHLTASLVTSDTTLDPVTPATPMIRHRGSSDAGPRSPSPGGGTSNSFKEEFFRNGPLGMFLVVPAVNVNRHNAVIRARLRVKLGTHSYL